MISINELLISINELLISINELLISINELLISIKMDVVSIFIDINKYGLNVKTAAHRSMPGALIGKKITRSEQRRHRDDVRR